MVSSAAVMSNTMPAAGANPGYRIRPNYRTVRFGFSKKKKKN